MDRKITIIIILSLIVLFGSGVYAYNTITNKAYIGGINDATLNINQQILNSLQQSGYVPFVFVENNQTYNVRLGVIQNQNE